MPTETDAMPAQSMKDTLFSMLLPGDHFMFQKNLTGQRFVKTSYDTCKNFDGSPEVIQLTGDQVVWKFLRRVRIS